MKFGDILKKYINIHICSNQFFFSIFCNYFYTEINSYNKAIFQEYLDIKLN